MSRGKDEKTMGPMFPRLHVNDTEKGGPRAPPRNKMALYEQLSIPSQRFNHSTSANLAPPSIQGDGSEVRKFFSGQLPPRHQSDMQNSTYTDISSPLTQVVHRAKSDEDDFRVPNFSNSYPSQEAGRYTNQTNIEKPMPSKASYFGRALNFPKAKDPSMVTMEQERMNGMCENPKEISTVKAVSNPLVTKKNESPKKQINLSLHEQGNYHDLSNATESQDDGSYASMDRRSVDRADSVSEASILDSESVQDMITPDDVVGIIGQKHFWKARRAISNQQRVFAVQVFELHRLLKVQKLIAASPNLLIEDSAYYAKPVKPMAVKKVTSDCSVKASANIPNKVDSDKQSQKKEHSVGHNVEKPSFSSAQNTAPPPGGQPFANNSPAPSINSDHQANPWCFGQPLPHGQQWLIPVMSPSEGLVYKPYPAQGFMGPTHGPPVPNGSNLPAANFFPPPYGVPQPYGVQPHPQYQYPAFPGPHGYFPPYGMPLMNGTTFSGSSVDQTTPHTNPSAMNGQFSAGKANVSTGKDNVSVPNPKRGGFTNASNMNPSEDMEVQASTASSQCEVPLGFRARSATEGRNVLKLFPTSPVNDPGNESRTRLSEPERLTQVIRVVPHNARTATESAARIFQSIQEERKQYDSL